MIAIPSGVRILVATKPVDFRRGADSLTALAKEELQRDPFSGTILVFRSKRAQRLSLCTPSLESGQSDGSIVLIFLEGLWASGDHAEGAFADGSRVERGDRDEPSCAGHQLTGG